MTPTNNSGTAFPAGVSANGPEVAAKIRAMGAVMNPELINATISLYVPLLAQADWSGLTVTKDIAYGPHQRHRLDVYTPDRHAAAPLPILLCLHGGGFVRGDKHDVSNVCAWFARNGVAALTMNYRYAPEIRWPQGAEDVAAALRWIKDNAGAFGGDPDRVFLWGTSAGAAHISTYVFFEEFHLEDGDGVRGAVLFSGPAYETSVLTEMDNPYYGKDAAKFPAMSVIEHIEGRNIPVFVVVAELDPPSIVHQNHALIEALYQRDKNPPAMKTLMGHNHISETLHFNTKDESVGPDILAFINVHSGK